uniref:Uncharacterized protein n=1 Tax=Meloidogyne enterolobii TaxID=390850 RepID=A0A6V7VI46_MELEN|nr:unnamed protein product [Meloidogyne enterolobii]
MGRFKCNLVKEVRVQKLLQKKLEIFGRKLAQLFYSECIKNVHSSSTSCKRLKMRISEAFIKEKFLNNYNIWAGFLSCS